MDQQRTYSIFKCDLPWPATLRNSAMQTLLGESVQLPMLDNHRNRSLPNSSSYYSTPYSYRDSSLHRHRMDCETTTPPPTTSLPSSLIQMQKTLWKSPILQRRNIIASVKDKMKKKTVQHNRHRCSSGLYRRLLVRCSNNARDHIILHNQ